MWCNKNITYSKKTVILDKMFFAKYTKQSGFKIAIDGMHKVPKDTPYIVYYTLNPPAPHYEDPENTDQIEINTQIDWARPLGLLKYHDSWKIYRDVDHDPFLHIIVEVKEIKPR